MPSAALCTTTKRPEDQLSVAIVDGQYVSKYKDQVIRVITKNEYRMFPNLWTRVMSAWIAMMAVFCARSFTLPSYLRRGF